MDGIRPHLIAVCIDARQSRELVQSTVAGALNIDQSKVARFEQGKGGFHRETEKIVSGYAKVAGVEPIALWRAAIDRWAAAQAEAPGATSEVPAMESVRETQPSSKTNRAKDSRAAG